MTSAPQADQALRESIVRVLRDFVPEWADDRAVLPCGGARDVAFVDLPIPRVVQWVLEECLGAKDGGRWEKVAWTFWFTYRDRPFNLAFTKFGLRLSGFAESDEEFAELADEILRKLDAAARIAEREAFQPFADQQVAAGSVDSRRLRDMYEYFRAAAEEGLSDEEVQVRERGNGFIRLFVRDEHRFRYSVALVEAYFGWLEHVLVLCWPFCGYRPGVDDVRRFIGDHWGDKFKNLFDVSTDREAKCQYDALRSLAEEYRNTFAHGGFGRHQRGILVHVPGGAPIEAGPSDIRNRPHFEFAPIPEESLADIGEALDAVDGWLRTGPAHFGMKWIEAGLDVPFDAKSVQQHVAAMGGGEDTFELSMERWSHLANQAANMDW